MGCRSRRRRTTKSLDAGTSFDPIDATIVDELAATGSVSTRMFQTLSAGKT